MKVYIAGPYTNGDVIVNVRAALEVADRVAVAGHYPFIPHLYHFWHFLYPHGYSFWTGLDMAWLEECEAVIRLGGESDGADKEVDRAEDLGIPVYTEIEFFNWIAREREKLSG